MCCIEILSRLEEYLLESVPEPTLRKYDKYAASLMEAGMISIKAHGIAEKEIIPELTQAMQIIKNQLMEDGVAGFTYDW